MTHEPKVFAVAQRVVRHGLLALLAGTAQPTAPALVAHTTFRAAQHVERFDAAGYLADRWMLHARRGDAEVKLVVIILPQAHFTTSVSSVSFATMAGRLFRAATCPNAQVVTNGGFFWRSAKGPRPLGLVQVGGRTLSKPSGRKSGGFLKSDSGRLAVLPRTERAAALRADDAIESSPILIWDGRSGMRSDDGVRFDRVAIGTTADDHVVVAGAFARDQETVTLTEFGTLASNVVRTRGKKLQTLLALDGRPSAHIYLPQSNRLFGFWDRSMCPTSSA